MVPLIDEHLEGIRALCRRHGVERLFVYGSAAEGGFDPERSDVDFLVVFGAGPRGGYEDAYFGLREGLRLLLGREVDLAEARALRNPYFIASVNRTKRMLYAA